MKRIRLFMLMIMCIIACCMMISCVEPVPEKTDTFTVRYYDCITVDTMTIDYVCIGIEYGDLVVKTNRSNTRIARNVRSFRKISDNNSQFKSSWDRK